MDHWWWPESDGYWPEGVRRELTLEAFVAAYATKGFYPCDNGDLEEGYEKIALYGKQNVPTHASIRLSNGRWASKLGQWEDIEHESLPELGEYGVIICFLKRSIRTVRIETQETGEPPRKLS